VGRQESPSLRLARSNALRAPSAFAAAALSSVLAALAYPGPADLWPLAFVAGAPLYVAVQGQTLRRRLALGWFSGVLTVALVAHWLPAAYQRVTGRAS
jgi:apolipoprotein N-acyltransferase